MGSPGFWLDAIEHLSSSDPRMGDIITQYREPRLKPNGNVGRTLIKAVVGQQISVQAADAVWSRMTDLLGQVTPQSVLQVEIGDLRGCGLSMRKSEYITGIAKEWCGGLKEVDWSTLNEPQVKDALMKIRGVGPWTVDMALIFSLGLPDIFPTGDVGLLRAVEKNYAGGERLPLEDVISISEPWKPYRTVATWYLWRTIDPEPVNY